MIVHGYVVDKEKHGCCRDGYVDSYVALGNRDKFSKVVKTGEFLSEKRVRDIGCKKSDYKDLLIKVSIDDKKLKKYGNQYFPSFGEKYKIEEKGYKPNRFNVNRYKVVSGRGK